MTKKVIFKTESDVEQKLIYPFLKNILLFNDEEIKTKNYLIPSDIDKGAGKTHGYYPDYVVYIGGIPVVVVEAKDPSVSVDVGHREARLYAVELNKKYPKSINPVKYVLAFNGIDYMWGPWDSESDISSGLVSDLKEGVGEFDILKITLSRVNLSKYAADIRRQLIPTKRFKPLRLIGGPSQQHSEIAMNTFSIDLIPLLRRYFDPDETKWSSEVLEKGYCSSDELTKYNSTLEALLKDRLATRQKSVTVETSKKDAEGFSNKLRQLFRGRRDIPDPFVLVVGGVGSGKSMFIERYYSYLMDKELSESTRWAVVDFNKAPESLGHIESWMCSEFISDFSIRNGGEDFLDYENLRRYFAPSIAQRERGPYKELKKVDKKEFEKRMADDLRGWTDDSEMLSSGIIRYFSKDKNIPVIVVFDNVDKRDRDQQLTIFQAVQWFRNVNKCFTLLTMRDETYDAYKDVPPLDAFLQTFTFRIIPPRFINVVRKRLELAIAHLTSEAEKTLSYTLPNGMQVTYPATNLGKYLLSLYVSIFRPTRKISVILEALSDKNIRRALEMFTHILTSGYVSEDLILSLTEGRKYEVPEWLIIKILMRSNYQYYSDGHGYIYNVFDLPENSFTAHIFLVGEVLEYLARRRKIMTTFKVEGYHYVNDIISHMSRLGLLKEDTMWALEKLLNRGLIVADHQRTKGLVNEDYVKITASGYYHVRFMITRSEYLSNICVDTWFNNEEKARQISRIMTDSYKHSNKRIELFRDYIEEEKNVLTENLPEFENAHESIDRHLESINNALVFVRK